MQQNFELLFISDSLFPLLPLGIALKGSTFLQVVLDNIIFASFLNNVPLKLSVTISKIWNLHLYE